MSTTPRIYVACLSSYNAGILHGAWIDADQDAEAIHAEIRAMLAKSTEAPAEEWAIHDYEGFHGVKLGEYESIEDVAALGDFLREHEDAGAAYVNNEDVRAFLSRTHPCRDFEEAYRGRFDDMAHYAEEMLEQTGGLDEVPDNLRSYFDFEAFGRDMELGGDVWTTRADAGGIHVFDNN